MDKRIYAFADRILLIDTDSLPHFLNYLNSDINIRFRYLHNFPL